MLNCQQFYESIRGKGIDFFTGVPDSLLKDICAYITDHTAPEKNIIAANEGNAIALAAGYHLATGKVGMVYLQNSGLGNCVNPLTSLTDPEVYAIPVILMVGWRGEPGKKDEPQHKKMGRIMTSAIQSIEVPYAVLPADFPEAEGALEKAFSYAVEHSTPYGLVVKEGTFEPYQLQTKTQSLYPLNREQAIRALVPLLGPDDIIVSTTGKTSRELFELRAGRGEEQKDFLTVGSMGHASSIALGIALQKQGRIVYCFDGDGAAIMHMGSMATIGKLQPRHFRHIIFNNFVHDSVGGQPTAADAIDFCAIARANGYRAAFRAETESQIKEAKENMENMGEGPVLLEIRCNKGARADLGRPTSSPLENKRAFMRFVQK